MAFATTDRTNCSSTSRGSAFTRNLPFEISAQNENGLRKAGSLSAARLERCDGSEVNPAIERVALMNRSSPRTR